MYKRSSMCVFNNQLVRVVPFWRRYRYGIRPGKVSSKLFLIWKNQGIQSLDWSCPLLKKMGYCIQPWQQFDYIPPRCQGALLAVNGWGMDGSVMLGKALGQVDRSGLNCAQNLQLGFTDTSVLRRPKPITRKQQLSAPKGAKRFDVQGRHREGPSHQCRISPLSQVDHGRLRP